MAREGVSGRARRDGPGTRDRILEATRKELLSHGFAGARMDRIARRARTSKERIYHYFRSKEELANMVVLQQAERLQERVKFDPEDIDSFIGALFDFYFDDPEEVRLWLWFLLEKGGKSLPGDDFRVAAVKERIASIRCAQAAGHIDPNWNPILLLDLIISLAVSRVIAPDYVHEVAEKELDLSRRQMIDRHRAAVIEITHRLIAEAPSSETSGA